MVTLANLHQFVNRGHRVSVIGPSTHHYYSGMGPGMLSKIYRPEEIRFATRHLVEKQGGTFVLDKVIRVEPTRRMLFLKSGEPISYDVLSFNAGSYVPQTGVAVESENIFTVKPIERLLEAQKRLMDLAAQKSIRVAVIGGGAAAVEVAGNLWRLLRAAGGNGSEIAVYTGDRLLDRFPEKVRIKGIESLQKRGVKISEHSYVAEIRADRITLESGESHEADMVFLATGVRPSTIFKESGLPTGADDGLLVNRYLQSTGFPEIFGGGDCIYFEDHPLEKVGVYAVRQNPVLFHNLMASLEQTRLMPFEPGGEYLLIFNMGDGTGIFYKKGFMLGGRPAFWIKDYIDRKFIKKFQAYE